METHGVFRSKETSLDESKSSSISDLKHGHLNRPLYATPQSTYGIMFWIAVIASQIVGLVCVSLITYFCTLYGGYVWSDKKLMFNFHPLFMILGLVFFYGDAIIVYRVCSFLPKWLLKWIHAGLHIMAILFSSVGLTAVLENHRLTNYADFYSLHSWVGIAAFGCFCLQYVLSFATFLFPGLPPKIRAIAMPFHTFFGVGIFLMAVSAAHMGLTEKLIWTSNYTSRYYIKEGIVGNSLGLLLVVFAFLIVFLATHSKYKRRPLPSEISQSTN